MSDTNRRSDLRRFLSYGFDYKLLLLGAILAGFGKFGLNYSFPWLIGTAIDTVIEPKVPTTGEDRIDQLWMLVGIGLGLSVLQMFFTYFRSHWASLLGNRIIRDLRQDIFDHLHRLSLHFYSRERTGSIISRIITDISEASQIVNGGMIALAMDLFSMFLGLYLLLSIDWRMTLAAIVVLPLYAVTFKLLNPKVKRASSRVQQQISKISGNVQEQLAGIALVKSYAAEPRERARFREDTEEHYERATTQRSLAAGVTSVSECLVHLGQVLVIGVAGYLAVSGDVTPGEVVKFLGWLAVMYFPIRRFAEINVIYQQSSAAIERVFRVFDITPRVANKDGALDKVPDRGEVIFDDVVFDYHTNATERLPEPELLPAGRGERVPTANPTEPPPAGNGRPPATATTADAPQPRNVLDHLSFHVKPGERVAFVGPSGAGKTTLVTLLPRLYDVTGGRILVDGVDLRDYKQRKLRKAIGIVQQDSFLFSGTIRDNITYGRPNASETELIEAATAANAHGFISELPDGYDSVVGERGVTLSGGQKQRVSIARAILKDPRILILDEATSALDSESERLVQEALDRLMRGRTSFIIAHRLSTVRNADRIFVMKAGKLVEEGPHDVLIKQGGLYARLCAQQFGVEAVEQAEEA